MFHLLSFWKDNPEHHRGQRKGAFLHGYKGHYDFSREGKSLEFYNRIRHSQS